jgi:hypothetical protein
MDKDVLEGKTRKMECCSGLRVLDHAVGEEDGF